jgi:hypothetical protein
MPMGALSLEKVCELLGTTELPGDEQQGQILAVRIEELLELNGEDWVRENRRMLLDQWRRVVELKTNG